MLMCIMRIFYGNSEFDDSIRQYRIFFPIVGVVFHTRIFFFSRDSFVVAFAHTSPLLLLLPDL